MDPPMCLQKPFLILVGIVMKAVDELEEAIDEAIQSIKEEQTDVALPDTNTEDQHHQNF
jgi:hypothetical protein